MRAAQILHAHPRHSQMLGSSVARSARRARIFVGLARRAGPQVPLGKRDLLGCGHKDALGRTQMAEQDRAYRLLFSNRQMVSDLLKGFVNEPWVEKLRLETLERYARSYVSERLRERESDVVWRVRYEDQWLYVYILIEFQTTVDPYMALRLLVYVGLLYQDLGRSEGLGAGQKLPPVVPIVLYNGERPWAAPCQMSELVQQLPGGLQRYVPRLEYLLLEERRYGEEQLRGMRNVAAALFRLENSREPSDAAAVIEALAEWLSGPEQAELRRAFVTFLRAAFLGRRVPDAELPEVAELTEVKAVLAERVEEWLKRSREEGRQEGRQEGITKGRIEGQAELLLRQLERKFGPLPAELRGRVLGAEAEQLLRWGERVLTAERLEEVFE